MTGAAVEACCSTLYGHPLAELVAGQSLHPGGLATTRRLLSAARLPPGSRLLDAGCGLGASARLAVLEHGLAVEACDTSDAAVQRAGELSRAAGLGVEFRRASVLALPWAAASFTAALAECVLSTTDRERALAELRRVTADGGALLLSDVTVTGPVDLPEPLGRALCVGGAWRPGELEPALEGAGFRVERDWDESAQVGALVDRIEARLGLLATVLRDEARRREPAGDWRELADVPGLGTLLAEVRALVAEGRIGYRAVVARAE